VFFIAWTANTILELDNIKITSDEEVVYYADVTSYSDYYPFGMQMPGRNGSTGDYRYGFNGMESDDEVKGEGNSYTTHFRQYDPRIGRWLSLDPVMAKYPNQSPYAAFNNNPIYFIDPEGDDPPPHSNLMKVEKLDPFDVRSQIESDRKAGKDFKYNEGMWDMYRSGLHRMADSDIWMLKRKGENQYYKAYFVPEIRKNENGEEYADEKLGHYVLQPVKRVDDWGISTFRGRQDSSTDGTPSGIPLSVNNIHQKHRGVKQQEAIVNGILENYNEMVESISASNDVNNHSFEIQSIDIAINANLDADYKSNLVNTLNQSLGKNYKLNITESSRLSDETFFTADVKFNYERYEE